MKSIHHSLILLLLIFSFVSFGQNKELDWANMVTFDHEMVQANGMQVFADNDGNTISIIPFQWDIHLGKPPKKKKDPEPPTVSAGDQFGFYLIKSDSEGNLIWNQVLKMGNRDRSDNLSGLFNTISDLSVVNGNIYLTGSFEYTLDFGNNVMLESQGRNDMFVAKIDGTGQAAWAIRAGGSGTEYAEADPGGQSITADQNGNVYAIGTLNAYPNGGGTIQDQSLDLSKDGATMTLMKLSSSGDILWFKKAAAGTGGTNKDLSVDNSGNLYIGGATKFMLDWQGNQITANGLTDAFLMKLDSDGNYLWGKTWGWGSGPFDGKTMDNEGISKMAVSPEGTITALMTLHNGAQFGDLTISKSKGALGELVTFAATIDKDGNILNTYSFDGDPLAVPNPLFGTFSAADGGLYFTLGKKAKINGEKIKDIGIHTILPDGSWRHVYDLTYDSNVYGFGYAAYTVSNNDVYSLVKLMKLSDIIAWSSPNAGKMLEKQIDKKYIYNRDVENGIILMKFDLD